MLKSKYCKCDRIVESTSKVSTYASVYSEIKKQLNILIFGFSGNKPPKYALQIFSLYGSCDKGKDNDIGNKIRICDINN